MPHHFVSLYKLTVEMDIRFVSHQYGRMSMYYYVLMLQGVGVLVRGERSGEIGVDRHIHK